MKGQFSFVMQGKQARKFAPPTRRPFLHKNGGEFRRSPPRNICAILTDGVVVVVYSQFQGTKLRTKIEGILPLLTHEAFPSFSPTNLHILCLSFSVEGRGEKEVGRYPLHPTFTVEFSHLDEKKPFFSSDFKYIYCRTETAV